MKMCLPFSISILKPLLVLLIILSILESTKGLVKCNERERLALLDFKKSFVSFYSYKALSSWESAEENCCSWEGITCHNLTRHVIGLNLQGSLQSYQLRPSLLELHHLRRLDLSFNNFVMRIPKFFGSFKQLRYLNLQDAGFFGKIPPHLGNLTNIKALYLTSLHQYPLSVDSFQWLSHLSSLEYLDMSYNNLTEAKDWLSIIRRLPSLASFECLSCSLPPPVLSSSDASTQLNFSTSLETLDLSGSILSSSTISWLTNSTSNLSSFSLSGVNSLEWLPHLSSLERLVLSLSNFTYARDWLSPIINLPLLASFQCLACSFPPPVFPSMASHHVNCSTSLQSLVLEESYLPSSAISWLLNSTSNLSSLSLWDVNLEGPFPDIFHNMISLEDIDIVETNLEGVIFKSSGNLCNLKTLTARRSSLKGSLGDIFQALTGCASSSLEYLDLGSNNLTGVVPPMLKFSSLRYLDLSYNRLETFSPQNATLHSKLHVPNISTTHYFINGSLQNTLQLFPASLRNIDLSFNSLNGVLSEVYFTNLYQLTHLDLSNNPILIINFSKCPAQVEYLYLTSCKLGSIFPNWLLTHTRFVALDISSCNISGSIPDIFWKNLPSSLVYLNISFNSFHDLVPNLPFPFKERELTIDLTSNAFYGPIPSLFLKANELLLSNNSFSGFSPLPHSNNFTTITPPNSVQDFGFPCNVLDVSSNCLSGVLPNWFWFHLPVLGTLNLGKNNLSGVIPNSIGFTSQLFVLSLRNNSFSGPLPLWLRNCSEVRILDLSVNKFSGFIPFWIGKEMKNLNVLSLGSNQLMGIIPSNLCHLNFLQILDLSHNRLSGHIPYCVYSLTAMVSDVSSTLAIVRYERDITYGSSLTSANFFNAFIKWKGMEHLFQKNLPLVKLIDLSNNNFNGDIPVGLTSLQGLQSLDLSSNNLQGSIPSQIGQLKSLEVLNLSYNRLCGQIPSSLSEVSSLDVVDFSHNNLSGRIPPGTQLQGFNSSVYAGNPKLCGLPLPIKCPGDGEDSVEVLQPSAIDDNIMENKWQDNQYFCAGLGTGFASGFLMVLGTLTMIRKWRYSFFHLASHFADWILVVVAINSSKISRKLGFK